MVSILNTRTVRIHVLMAIVLLMVNGPSWGGINLAPKTATNDVRVLPDYIPASSNIGQPVEVRLCTNEFEAASFVIRSSQALQNVMVSVSSLTAVGGETLAGDSVDVHWVKCWYQGSTYLIAHRGNYLIPELLLKNPGLIEVDLVNEVNVYPFGRFPKREYPDDATTLQPLPQLPANSTQQVWLTINVPDDTAPGVYLGQLQVSADGVSTVTLPIEVEVFEFTLEDSNYEHGVYHFEGGWGPGTDMNRALAEMYNLRDHGITQVGFRCENPADLFTILPRLEWAGFDCSRLFILTYSFWVNVGEGTSMSPAAAYALADSWRTTATTLGVDEIYLYLQDELNDPCWLAVERGIAEAIHDAGCKTWVAVHNNFYPHAIDFIDVPNASFALTAEQMDVLHTMGAEVYCYGRPQTGVELPGTQRKNYGLQLLYQDGHDGSMNYTFWGGAGDPWDDFDTPHWRDHCFVHPTLTDMVDTAHWEGYREGIDDCRYLATLQYWIAQARGFGGNTVADAAEAWLSDLKTGGSAALADLEQVRSQMIQYILLCRGDICGGTGTVLAEDLNRDCVVDLADMALLVGDWAQCTDPCQPMCDEYWRE